MYVCVCVCECVCMCVYVCVSVCVCVCVCVSSSVDSHVVSISKTSASFVITRMVELICLESSQSVHFVVLGSASENQVRRKNIEAHWKI